MDNFEQSRPELEFKAIFSQLGARKYFLLFICILGIFTGLLFAIIPANEYRVSSVIQVESRKNGVTLPTELIGTILSGDGAFNSSFESERHIIRSRLILEPVAEELDLFIKISQNSLPIWGNFLERTQLLIHLPQIDAFIPAKYARGNEVLKLKIYRL